MKKKIIIGSILAVFMLMTISFVSTAEVSTNIEQRESPLYSIRTRRAIGEKVSNIIENIKAKFLGERIFFMPFKIPRNRAIDIPNLHDTYKGETYSCPTCDDLACDITYLFWLSIKICTVDADCY